MPFSRSKSSQCAALSSPGRENTSGRSRSAARVAGCPSYPSIARSKPPNSIGSVIAARCLTLGGVSAPRNGSAGSLVACAVAMARRKTAERVARSRRAVSSRPRFSTCSSTASTSAGCISAIGREPSDGLARESSHSVFASVRSARPLVRSFSTYFPATLSNVAAAAIRSESLFSFSSTAGSRPAATFSRAFSRFSRALMSDVAGYAPNASVFCFPSNRYEKRHSLPPDGLTRRCKPPPSETLNGFERALRERMARSVSGICGPVLVSGFQMMEDTNKRTNKFAKYQQTVADAGRQVFEKTLYISAY